MTIDTPTHTQIITRITQQDFSNASANIILYIYIIPVGPTWGQPHRKQYNISNDYNIGVCIYMHKQRNKMQNMD